MQKLKKLVQLTAIFVCASSLYSSEGLKTTINNPQWSFFDDFEGTKNSEFWIGNGLYAQYGIVDPTDSNNKVLKLSYVPDSAGETNSSTAYSFNIPIDAVELSLSWKQYIPKNYKRLRNFQNFFTIWSGEKGMKKSNITLGSSLWGRYSDSGSMASIRAGIDGIDYGHNMNSNKKIMLENQEGKWINMYVIIQLAKDSTSFGKIDIYKDGKLITGTSSDTLLQAYGGVPEGNQLIKYSTKGNYINKGTLLGWANGSFEETVDFLIDDFKVLANSTFEEEQTNVTKSDFVNFKGASEDKIVIDDLLEKHFKINEPKRIIYVAPFIEGSIKEGSGESKDNPRRNLKAVLESAQPGDHIYLAPGVYRIDKERDNFGRESSQFDLKNSGTFDDRIVLKTDPNLWDPKSGSIAQIDFGFDNYANVNNKKDDNSSVGFLLRGSNWVFEDLEIRNAINWIFKITGKHILIRNNNIHHVNILDTTGNNEGLIVIGGEEKLYNLIMNNHIHHAGQMDEEGNLLDFSKQTGVSGGCTYTLTGQTYQTLENMVAGGWKKVEKSNDALTLMKNGKEWIKNLTWEEMLTYIEPSDDEAYYYNNLINHCYPYGLGTKAEADGKFYFLSNIIHSAEYGIKITLNHSQIKNNIVYKGDFMEAALKYGYTPNSVRAYAQVKNAVDIKVENNTFVGVKGGIINKGGWNGLISNNIFLDIPTPHYVAHNYYGWAYITGEYFYGDLDLTHPYFEKMPIALQAQVGNYKKLKVENNIYTTEPILKRYAWEGNIDYLPTKEISENYLLLPSETIKSYLVDPENNDYRRNKENPGVLDGIGSGIQ